jgi:hypothetical protein
MHFSNISNKKCLDVHGNRDEEARKVIVHGRHNGANQRWRIVYTDKAAKEPTSGYTKEWGFYINRPFYLRSRLPMQRVAELVGSDIRLRRYTTSRWKQQTWRFDVTSKTIKSMYQKTYSMEIPNSGRNNQLRATTTNSRWW